MNTTCSQLGKKSRRKLTPPAMVTHWCFLVPILAIGLITAPDLATAQQGGVPPTIAIVGARQRSIPLKPAPFGPPGTLGNAGIPVEFGVSGNPFPVTTWTFTPANQYVSPTLEGQMTPNISINVQGNKGAAGTYTLTFTSQNVINGITNIASETVTIRVYVEGAIPPPRPVGTNGFQKISLRLTHGDRTGIWKPSTNINQPDRAKPPFIGTGYDRAKPTITGSDRMDRIILRGPRARIANGNR